MVVNGAHNLVIPRLSIIIASSLAQNSHHYGTGSVFDTFFPGELKKSNRTSESFGSGKSKSFNSNAKITDHTDTASNYSETNQLNPNASTCSVHPDPCAELQDSVSHLMALIPLAIALMFFIVGALPTLLLRSRHRVLGVRSCLWVLIELWIHLLISYTWFMLKEDRAQAYVWALHAAAHVLASWRPRTRVIPYPGLQTLASLAGVGCVALFAWQFGPPVGLAAWNRRSDAQCGWAVHLTAVIGVELVAWGLGPLEWAVAGLD